MGAERRSGRRSLLCSCCRLSVCLPAFAAECFCGAGSGQRSRRAASFGSDVQSSLHSDITPALIPGCLCLGGLLHTRIRDSLMPACPIRDSLIPAGAGPAAQADPGLIPPPTGGCCACCACCAWLCVLHHHLCPLVRVAPCCLALLACSTGACCRLPERFGLGADTKKEPSLSGGPF